ncbi:MAG: response regulator [Anaerolineae bacterium]|jgi:DNA-binding response OmpR family regulator|nr:response regulator [Anaerolineae bacterium]
MPRKSDPILIVEDLKHVREMLEITLGFRGYEVITATNGEEALKHLMKIKPRLVITDILMPNMDGFSLVHQIRNMPNLSDVPIIFLSATYTKAEDYDFAEKLGADKFLKKPYNVDDLLMAVDNALTTRHESVAPLNQKEFNQRHRDRLEQKLRHKNDLIERMEKLLDNLPLEQRTQFEALLKAEMKERDTVLSELQGIAPDEEID